MFDNEEIVITRTLRRAKLITRKTGKTTVCIRKGFVKVVIPLIKLSLMWELLKAYDFRKVKKINKKRKGDKTNRLLIISILTARDSKGLWHCIFNNDKSFKLTVDSKNLKVKSMRKRRQLLRGRSLAILRHGASFRWKDRIMVENNFYYYFIVNENILYLMKSAKNICLRYCQLIVSCNYFLLSTFIMEERNEMLPT